MLPIGGRSVTILTMLIFLDFDGVLRRNTSPLYKLEPGLVRRIEDVVCAYESVRVVITSSWREVYSLSELRRLFSAEFASRIEGATPIAHERSGHYRHREILAYLETTDTVAAKWLAIDDDALHFPANAPVMIVDPAEGFTDQHAKELEAILRRFGSL